MNLLYRIGDLLSPDLVLVGFYDNDVKHQLPVREERNRWEFPFPEHAKEVLVSHSKLVRSISMGYDQALLKLGVRSDDTEAVIEHGYDVNSEDRKQFVS